jgi:hypothetical protein
MTASTRREWTIAFFYKSLYIAMPPRRKKTLQQYVYVDSPEIRNLARGFARKHYNDAGYQDALVEANRVAARALAAPAGVRNAKSAFMIGVDASRGGSLKFVIPASAKEVISKLKLTNRTVLDREFKAGILPPDPTMPGLVRSIIRGEPVMKTYHFKEDPSAVAQGGAVALPVDEWADIY